MLYPLHRISLKPYLPVLIGLALLKTNAYCEGSKSDDEKPQTWQELKNCRLVDSKSNDGDSFHVLHKGKEFVARLYLVDAPETDLTYPSRNTEQAEEFQSTLEKTIACGVLAKELTQKLLDRPFTVITKGEDAKGSSKLGRQYAIVYTFDKKDLGQVLLEHGLARSHGQTPNSKNKSLNSSSSSSKSRKYDQLQNKYDQIAQKAQRKNLGAWGEEEIKLSSSLTPNTNTTTPNKLNQRDIEIATKIAKDIIEKKENKRNKSPNKISGDNEKTKNSDPTQKGDNSPNKIEENEYEENSIFSLSLQMKELKDLKNLKDSFIKLGKKETISKKEEDEDKNKEDSDKLSHLARTVKNDPRVLNAISTTGLNKNDLDLEIRLSKKAQDNRLSRIPWFFGTENATTTSLSLKKESNEKHINKNQKTLINKAILEVLQDINYYFFKSENLKISSRLALQEAELWQKVKEKENQLMASISKDGKLTENTKSIDNKINSLKEESEIYLERSARAKKRFLELSGLHDWNKYRVSEEATNKIGEITQKSANNSPSTKELLFLNNILWDEKDIAYIKNERLKLNKEILEARQKSLKTLKDHEALRNYRNKSEEKDFSELVCLLKTIDLMESQRIEFDSKSEVAIGLSKLIIPVNFK
jgi:endonuclease YncB( thermonuclease family)